MIASQKLVYGYNRANVHQRLSIVTRARSVHQTFYKENDLYRFDNKNVIYIAYVGCINNEQIFKYGKSAKLFQREFQSHRNNFNTFDMRLVKITDNKDVVEELFEKELLIRNIHRNLVINSKRQTELFTVTEEYNIEYIRKLLNRIIKNNPSYEVLMLKRKIEKLEAKLKNL